MPDLHTGAPFQYEPKRNNRFYLRFPQELDMEYWLVQMVERPKYEASNVEIPMFNTSNWVEGRYTWSTLTIDFFDYIHPSTSQKITNWLRLHSESITGRQGYAAGYKKDLELEAADPTGVAIEKWLIKEAYVTNIDYGTHDYSDDGIIRPKVTIQPFYCTLLY